MDPSSSAKDSCTGIEDSSTTFVDLDLGMGDMHMVTWVLRLAFMKMALVSGNQAWVLEPQARP